MKKGGDCDTRQVKKNRIIYVMQNIFSTVTNFPTPYLWPRKNIMRFNDEFANIGYLNSFWSPEMVNRNLESFIMEISREIFER
jgi:hypothetical protein